MPKLNTIYVCKSCGNESLKWTGRCSVCGEWNTMSEISVTPVTRSSIDKDVKPEKLSSIKIEQYQRVPTFSAEFDRVLGGGIVPGSVILLGGEPGIGKSTLLLQIVSSATKHKNKKVLYVSGEESKEQLKMRAERLKINSEGIYLLSETNVDFVIQSLSTMDQKALPELLIIDSIQTMYDETYPSTPGSIVQVRECALKLQQVAKSKDIPIIMIGHITKDGSVAGPKTLEHLVDVVLYLEGERLQNLRLLHDTKNRFGATEEVGVFEMTEKGLSEVKNPSKIFLEEKIESPGSAVTSILSGTRAFLVEIQALISKSPFGYPKRTVSGFDLRRLDLLLAVLERKMKIPLSLYDVYINIVGGMKIEDRATDLAICACLYSAFQNKKIRSNAVLLGEVGLSGEIREVMQLNRRTKEAKALGYDHVIGPMVHYLEKALKIAIEP
ncbi:MAG: DNA repair protein RadA [Candidatus Berkelbacteria bacterium]|nr:DNA repair protein RadA [Candidatus Berkelbacteria bacterium]